MHTKIRLYSWRKTVQNTTKNWLNNCNAILQQFYKHRNVPWQLNISRFCELQLWFLVKTKWRVGQRSPENACFQVDYLCTYGFNLENLRHGFEMQCQILINVIIFVAYMLNLPLNTQKPHYCSWHARKWSLIVAHDSRLIYRAPTYIAVPLLGTHQPRYIGSTLYQQYIGLHRYHIISYHR